MDRPTFKKKVLNTFVRPRQLILLDSHGKNPSRSINIRLATLLGTIASLLLAALITGIVIAPNDQGASIIPQHLQLQRLYDQTQADLAESHAANELQARQLEGLKAELLKLQGENDDLLKRVQMLESILEARKSAGVQLINSDAKWLADGELGYDFTLVKGGSYPRYVSGKLLVTALSPEGEQVQLQLGKDSPQLPFRVETHTFLRGHAKWDYDWRPTKLGVSAVDHRGRELFQTEISVDGAVK